jgi:acyl-CoA thioester hydrolase
MYSGIFIPGSIKRGSSHTNRATKNNMLITKTHFKVRFNEVDALGIVWHGHYISFFEDGREAFGHEHGITYMDIYEKGFVAPVVKINCDYKKSLTYDQNAFVETKFINHPAAKIIFDYRILLADTLDVIATGTSVQVFIDSKNKELQLIAPDFFTAWKQKHKLI